MLLADVWLVRKTPKSLEHACWKAADPSEEYAIPFILEVGWLVERFKQTPFQLGLCPETESASLLYRCLHAVRVYDCGIKYNQGLDGWGSITTSEWILIARVREEIKNG